MGPTVRAPESDQSAMARPGGPGYEWPKPVQRLRSVFRGRTYRQDVVLGLCMLLLGLSPRSGVPLDLSYLTPVFVANTVVQALALVWRRKAPSTVYWVVLASCTVQWALGESSSSNLSLMICVFTVTRYRSARARRVAVAAAVPSLFVFVFRVAQVQHQILAGLLFLACAVAASVALGLVATERRAQLEALAERAAHAEFEREQRAQMAVLAERARFSREMHDIVGHSLAVITGLADGGVRQVEANPERGRQVLELIGETSRQALSDLRRTLGALRERPPEDDVAGVGAENLAPQPGVADIEELLERTRSAGPDVLYRGGDVPEELPRSLQLAVYRIVQESLTNSLKHAGPDTRVQVAVEMAGDALQVSVADTGSKAPYAVPPPAGPPGQGLTGVRERAALAGGRADAGPNGRGGWTVTARFPLQPSEEEAELR